MKEEEFKVKIVYGTVDLRTFLKREGDALVSYGYAIHRDRDGFETHRTEPEPLSRMTFV